MRNASTLDRRTASGLRQDLLAAALETLSLFLIFIVAITGRDAFSDGIKTFLTVLSVAAGAAGAFVGAWVLRRAFTLAEGRGARLGIAAWMLFAGIYTIVHVLS